MPGFHSFQSSCWSGQPLFRTVSFSNEIRVKYIPSRKSLSARQRKELWYPEPTQSRNLLRQVVCGSRPKKCDDDGGEIDFVDERSDRSLPVSAVLAEQESQREGHAEADPIQIAKIYQRCSSHSSVRAQMRAQEVQHDATKYLQEPSKHGKYKIVLLEKER